MTLNSLPLTNQKAGEIISVLTDGSVVVPMEAFWSYHQSPSSRIQDLVSRFENLAIRVQCEPWVVTSQYTCVKLRQPRIRKDEIDKFFK